MGSLIYNKCEDNKIKDEFNQLKSNLEVNKVINSLPHITFIVNKDQKIVYFNHFLMEMINEFNPDNVYGKRTGEVFKCIYSKKSIDGCNHSEYCHLCGAINAIKDSQQSNKRVVKECNLTVHLNQQIITYDFLVTSTPFKISDKNYSIISFTNISDQKRRKALENIFFHDILNTATSLKCFIDLLKRKDNNQLEKEKLIRQLDKINDHLIDEINSQKLLISAENGNLHVNKQLINIKEIMSDVIMQFDNENLGHDKKIEINPAANGFSFISDEAILKRILTNLIKNALEASPDHSVITICYQHKNEAAMISIHNPTDIEKEIQLQVFKRSFSTKGSNRGLGTYSVKLLTEQYLKGRVDFISNPQQGTTFFLELPIQGR